MPNFVVLVVLILTTDGVSVLTSPDRDLRSVVCANRVVANTKQVEMMIESIRSAEDLFILFASGDKNRLFVLLTRVKTDLKS